MIYIVRLSIRKKNTSYFAIVDTYKETTSTRDLYDAYVSLPKTVRTDLAKLINLSVNKLDKLHEENEIDVITYEARPIL